MVVGTASHVGKSWTATAICRYLSRKGLRVAPFKAQNMSLNSYACPGGGEIGRSQVAQAEACGIPPRPDMNPILLKPNGSEGCQVIVDGQVWKQLAADEYGRCYDELLERVEAAYQRLHDEFEYVVIEGAGGAAEINLRPRDLANLPLAVRLNTPALLVADIDRGGVFASVVGALSLLEPDEHALVRSFLVNRFRGDTAFFDEGRDMLVDRAGKPCLGVFPYARNIRLDPEDSLSLDETGAPAAAPGELRIVVVRFPHISNFTDFRLIPGAEYIEEPTRDDPDLIILPGTKNTLDDLAWLKKVGLDRWILDRRKEGTAVWGVCGGYQMLGRYVSDPHGVESSVGKLPGLGLLPIQTTLAAKKTTKEVRARLFADGSSFKAYEIHMGETSPAAGVEPFCEVDGRPEGFRQRGILGTYLHGALEDPAVAEHLLADVAKRRSKPVRAIESPAGKEEHYEKLADWFERHADLELFEELYL